jgi:hypothetical protein
MTDYIPAPGNIDLDERLEPYCKPSKAHVTIDVLNMNAVKAELIELNLRLIGALCEAEGVPVTFKAEVAPLVMRVRELVRP